MSLPELKYHLEFECMYTFYECKRCNEKLRRKDIKERHSDAYCINHMKEKVRELREIKKENEMLEVELQKLKDKMRKQD